MKKLTRFIKNLFSFNKDKGSLTIVGVGPGDPSLLTIAAIEAIKKSKIVFYPISAEDKKSYSAEIVKDYIKFKKQIPIVFPMGRKGFDANLIWKNSVDKIIGYLNKNYKVVLLCLGDTSIYASSDYILSEIKNTYPEIKFKVIPGITSLSLAAALSNFSLAKKGETLEILECPNDPVELSNLINDKNINKRVLVIMKVGIRWGWVKKFLRDAQILDKTLLAVNVGMKNQLIQKASDNNAKNLPYFSLILIRF